jgi:tRNA dimethylallyltransferase
LAVELAERLGGEVVSADSVQVYREFDVGSGKPTAEELARAPHHLVGAIDPLEPIDAASWAARASAAIEAIRARGRVPIVCGGTFLWVKALLYGLALGQGPVRLCAVDPESGARLHPNDLVRVSRALEVFELTGKPLSAWQKEHAFQRVVHRATLVAIRYDAAALTERIRERVRAWLRGGWIEEVQALLARGYGDARAMGSVGYAQVHAMLAGQLAREALEGALVRATRVVARRQRTWLNHAEVLWLDPAARALAARDVGQSSLGE